MRKATRLDNAAPPPIAGRRSTRFEQLVLPHLDAAFNLARWLAHNPDDARDVVQDACLRALRYADAIEGGEGRAWFLTIVRNAFYDWLPRNRPATVELDNEVVESHVDAAACDPLRQAEQASDVRALSDAVAALPLQFREVLLLREIEDLSYKEIARLIDAPLGTVMSRLSRARELLRHATASVHAIDTPAATRDHRHRHHGM